MLERHHIEGLAELATENERRFQRVLLIPVKYSLKPRFGVVLFRDDCVCI
jgi:hypothetical protein